MPAMGWFCGYTPLEVLYAAGFLPVRITGHTDSVTKADSCLHANMCQYVRSALDAALYGKYDEFKGAVFVNSCDAMRRLYDVWSKHVKMDFTFLLDLPRGRSAADVAYYRNEINKLTKALAVHFKVNPADGKIKAAVELYSNARDTYKALNDLRRGIPAELSGRKAADLAEMFCRTSPEQWVDNARMLIKSERGKAVPSGERLRIVLDGSPVHSPEIISFIEDCGFDVVADNFCSNSRLFDLTVDSNSNEDILHNLAEAYLARRPCSRMMRLDDRAAGIIGLVREYSAHGVIHISLKFCDTYLYDVPGLRNQLNETGIRSLFLETDGTLGSMGQLKTRIEAFAEMISGGIL